MAYVRLHLTLIDIWTKGGKKIGALFVHVKKSQSGHTVRGVFSPNLSVSACLYVCLCLSLTYTLVVLHLVAWRTDTSEGPIQILTSSWRAGAGQTHTLVDVCGE